MSLRKYAGSNQLQGWQVTLTAKLCMKAKDYSGVGKQMSGCNHQGLREASTCYVTLSHYKQCGCFCQKTVWLLFTKQLQVRVHILVANGH